MKKISDRTLRKSFLNWFFWNGCSQQAESMLGLAFGQSMAPVVDELYDNKEDKAAALKRHITLFNTEAQVGSICNGIVCGLEEANANKKCSPELISSVKVALIGPTSAIGDSLWVATLIPILLTICLSISQTSQAIGWLGPLVYMLVYPIGTFILSWYLFKLGYKSGIEGMQGVMSTGKLNSLTDTMTVLGLIVVGALTASFVNFTLPLQIVRDVYDATKGEIIKNQVIFDADKIVNSIFPHILPLLLTLFIYYLYSKKKWSPLKLMGLILVIACVITFIGYATGFYA